MSLSDVKKYAIDLCNKYEQKLNKTEFLYEIEGFKEQFVCCEWRIKIRKLILNFIYKKNVQDDYPNISIAYKIFLTLLVTSAFYKRRFSKLKLIKSSLRSSSN